MTTQVLFRTDIQTKEAFKRKTQSEGVSMDHILNVFIKTYIEKSGVVQTYIDDEIFDDIVNQSLRMPSARKASKSLYSTIKSAWL
jgi:hypothetical protein